VFFFGRGEGKNTITIQNNKAADGVVDFIDCHLSQPATHDIGLAYHGSGQ